MTIATTDVPVIVHGAADPDHPSGPITQTISIMPGHRVPGPATETIRLDGVVSYTTPPSAGTPPVYSSRRAAREAEQQAAGRQRPEAPQPAEAPQRTRPQGGPLAGSVLSPATWRQTVDALKKLR